jgi:hypothetical protein
VKLQSLESFALQIPFQRRIRACVGDTHRNSQHLGQGERRRWNDRLRGRRAARIRDAREPGNGAPFIDEHAADWCATIVDAGALADWAARRRTDVDAHPAAYAAVEIAILDLIGKSSLRSVESLLGLRELDGEFTYTAVLGDASARAFEAQLAHYLAAGFTEYKVKLGGDAVRDRAKVAILAASSIPPHKVRADANNLWNDADTALRALDALAYPFARWRSPYGPATAPGCCGSPRRSTAASSSTRASCAASSWRRMRTQAIAGSRTSECRKWAGSCVRSSSSRWRADAAFPSSSVPTSAKRAS